MSSSSKLALSQKSSSKMVLDPKQIKELRERPIVLSIGERLAYMVHGKLGDLSKRWFTHLFLLVTIIIYTIVGALLYSVIEGGPEASQAEELIGQRKDTMIKLKELVSSGSPKMMEQSEAVIKEYELELVKHYNRNSKILAHGDEHLNWDFWGSAFFCGSVYTMIGISPAKPLTFPGRVLTIVYTIIGIPLFLTLLADLGKSLTRWIKSSWIHIRRTYYTGSCSKRRPLATIQDDDYVEIEPGDAISFTENEDFTLPILFAFAVFVVYIFAGTVLYYVWEDWTFFESFYFVFITMATVGFGDFIPSTTFNQMFLICYLAFGLALTAMCINVVREKIMETIERTTAKLGGRREELDRAVREHYELMKRNEELQALKDEASQKVSDPTAHTSKPMSDTLSHGPAEKTSKLSDPLSRGSVEKTSKLSDPLSRGSAERAPKLSDTLSHGPAERTSNLPDALSRGSAERTPNPDTTSYPKVPSSGMPARGGSADREQHELVKRNEHVLFVKVEGSLYKGPDRTSQTMRNTVSNKAQTTSKPMRNTVSNKPTKTSKQLRK